MQWTNQNGTLPCLQKAPEMIYRSSTVPPEPFGVKQAWDEVAASMSSFSGITRSPAPCQKLYNDVRGWGERKLAGEGAPWLGTGT